MSSTLISSPLLCFLLRWGAVNINNMVSLYQMSMCMDALLHMCSVILLPVAANDFTGH